MCQFLKIARAGYYVGLHEPESGKTLQDKRLYSSFALFMMPVMASTIIVASRWILKS
jgi:hypothetical protein